MTREQISPIGAAAPSLGVMIACAHPPRAERRSVRVPCQVVRQRDFRLVARHSVDLSAIGMLARLDAPCLTGERVIVSLRVPGTSSTYLDAEGTVTRVVHGRRPEDDGRGLGIRFDATPPDAMDALLRQLAWFPLAKPRRSGVHARLWRDLQTSL